MTLKDLIYMVEWLFLLYFALLQFSYFAVNANAIRAVIQRGERRRRGGAPYRDLEPPITVIIPVYNADESVMQALKTVLAQEYSAFQTLIVNDGSTDDTLARLRQRLSLRPMDLSPRTTLPSQPVHAAYFSTRYQDVQVIDKQNGRKADALNAGINYARHDLLCMLDADSVLEPDSLRRAVRHFIDDERTIAVGGSLMVLNGATQDEKGFVEKAGLVGNYWVLIQMIEYLRAFLLGRLGWAPINALYIISGAFGLFRRDLLVEIGGYRTDNIGEDLDLTLRLHAHASEHHRPYRIAYEPSPMCWTEVPVRGTVLQQQRIRWHQGLAQSLWRNRGVAFRHGALGRLAFPFLVLFEWLSPVVEVAGYVFTVAAFMLGLLSGEALLAFLFMAIGLGAALSVSSLLLEEIAFRVFPRFRQLLVLIVVAFIENLGFRQIHAAWRLIGFIRGLRGAENQWH